MSGRLLMQAGTPSVVHVDARALQDPDYRYRGIGQHAASLLRALRDDHPWGAAPPRFVALTDRRLEPLFEEHRALFDDVATQPRAPVGAGPVPDWYLDLSPMTHDPVWAERLLAHPGLVRAALFYDLIPLEEPERYLATRQARADYLVSLSWLSRYDAFAAISRASADALVHRAGIDPRRVFVTGVAVREGLAGDRTPVPYRDRRAIVVAGGGDARKNPECAIEAQAGSAALRRAGIALEIFGNYPESIRGDLAALHAQCGGAPAAIRFHAHLGDDELHDLYRSALAVVVPSRAEGFSIPIVEASAAGTPVVVSDIPAHAELVRDPDWRFAPDEPGTLRRRLERLLRSESDWTALREAQSGLASEFAPVRVAERFVSAMRERVSAMPAPVVRRRARPQVGIVALLPSARAEAAAYVAEALRPLARNVDLHMITPTEGAARDDGWTSLSPLSAARGLIPKLDATLSVLGDGPDHAPILEFLLRNGGACLAYDTSLIGLHAGARGMIAAQEIATRETGRRVGTEEMAGWLEGRRVSPPTFLSEVAGAASPLIVPSRATAERIQGFGDHDVAVLPLAQSCPLLADIGSDAARLRARERLNVGRDRVLVTTFGPSLAFAPDLIWAGALLREWGIDALVAFGGGSDPAALAALRRSAIEIGVSDHVLLPGEGADTVDLLAASDVGVQFARDGAGAASILLGDCIAAGLPAIANDALADDAEAPSFVRRVPDRLSSVLIAEALMDVLGSRDDARRRLDGARDFARARSPAAYCEELCRLLGFEPVAERASR